MSSRRIAKVAEALRETISTTVLFRLKDPRVKNVTVLRTEVSPDLKAARVYVSVMGDETAQSLAMHGLRSARGFIQSQIAERLELRYTPILTFVLDPGVKLSIETSSIIRQALTGSEGALPAEDVERADSDDERGESPIGPIGPISPMDSAEEEPISKTSAAAATDRGARDVPGSELEQTTESTGI
jgi:ribosome-binding factor A